MKDLALYSVAIAVVLTLGCGRPPAASTAHAADTLPAPVEVDTAGQQILDRPFTAEEIRQEWVPGLVIFLRRSSPDGKFFERWTVLDADEEGAKIEYVDTDGSFEPIGEPSTNRST